MSLTDQTNILYYYLKNNGRPRAHITERTRSDLFLPAVWRVPKEQLHFFFNERYESQPVLGLLLAK